MQSQLFYQLDSQLHIRRNHKSRLWTRRRRQPRHVTTHIITHLGPMSSRASDERPTHLTFKNETINSFLSSLHMPRRKHQEQGSLELEHCQKSAVTNDLKHVKSKNVMSSAHTCKENTGQMGILVNNLCKYCLPLGMHSLLTEILTVCRGMLGKILQQIEKEKEKLRQEMTKDVLRQEA